jgi:hypothetical protein
MRVNPGCITDQWSRPDPFHLKAAYRCHTPAAAVRRDATRITVAIGVDCAPITRPPFTINVCANSELLQHPGFRSGPKWRVDKWKTLAREPAIVEPQDSGPRQSAYFKRDEQITAKLAQVRNSGT